MPRITASLPAVNRFARYFTGSRAASASADYVLSGHWSKAALKEAQKSGRARVAGSTEGSAFDRVPAQGELDLDPGASYLHFTSNNTIYGTQWSIDPEPPAGVPLVCDASSDALSRPIDVSRYAMIYAGAQKNLGPAGVTLVVIRKELLERTPGGSSAVLGDETRGRSRTAAGTRWAGLSRHQLQALPGRDYVARAAPAVAILLAKQVPCLSRCVGERGTRARLIALRLPDPLAESAAGGSSLHVGLAAWRAIAGWNRETLVRRMRPSG